MPFYSIFTDWRGILKLTLYIIVYKVLGFILNALKKLAFTYCLLAGSVRPVIQLSLGSKLIFQKAVAVKLVKNTGYYYIYASF